MARLQFPRSAATARLLASRADPKEPQVEIIDALYVCDGPAPNALTFRINLRTPGAIDQVGVVHHVQEKFDGRRTAIERFEVPPHHLFGSVTIEFAEEDVRRKAETFCEEALAASGMPSHATRLEMQHADPHHRQAERLMRDIYAAPVRQASSPEDHL